MAVSVDGFIANKNDETPWSDAEWQEFNKKAAEIGNVLIGRKTYELMRDDGSLGELPCKTIFVLSKKLNEASDKRVIIIKSPTQALKEAHKLGYSHLMVAGGSKTNSAFLKAGLVEELFLDVEPILLGSGIPLAINFDTQLNLELINTKRYGKSGIQLHYRMIQP